MDVLLRKDVVDWLQNVLLWRLREPDRKKCPGKHGKGLWRKI